MTHYIADTYYILFWTTLTLLYVYACMSFPYCDWAENCVIGEQISSITYNWIKKLLCCTSFLRSLYSTYRKMYSSKKKKKKAVSKVVWPWRGLYILSSITYLHNAWHPLFCFSLCSPNEESVVCYTIKVSEISVCGLYVRYDLLKLSFCKHQEAKIKIIGLLCVLECKER